MSFLEKPHHIRCLVLGSGTSQGVPMIGCSCPVCQSTDPRDTRTRCCLYVQTPEASLLIDAPPDLRQQALREKMSWIDAVLFTHAHADHIMGFDDLRRFCEILGKDLPIYGSAETLETLQSIFHYAFNQKTKIPGYVRVEPHLATKPFTLAGLEVTPLPMPHGRIISTGYLFARHGRKLLAYLTDCNVLPEVVRDVVSGVEVVIIDGVRDQPHATHFTVSGAVAAAAGLGAKQTYITHLAHDKSHVQRSQELPPGVALAYDGLRISFPWD